MKNKQIGLAKIIVAASALIGVIATFLPWMKISLLGISVSANGTDDYKGWISLIMLAAVLGIAVYSMYNKATWAKIAVTVASAIAFVMAIISLIEALSNGLNLGIGLILVIIASLVCAIIPWIKLQKIAKAAK